MYIIAWKNTPVPAAYRQLKNAVNSGNLEEVKSLVEQHKFDINFISEDDYGQTAKPKEVMLQSVIRMLNEE